MGTRFRQALWGALAAGVLATTWSPIDAGGQTPAADAPPAAEHFRVKQSARSDAGRPVRLDLFSASVAGDRLQLHLGFHNSGERRLDAFGLLTPDDYRLAEEGSTPSRGAVAIDPSITVMSPLDGLDPGFTNAGSASFVLPDSRGPFRLRVSGFEPIEFSLDPARTVRPPLEIEEIDVAPDCTLNSALEMLAIFAIRISRIELREKDIRFHLSFKNTSNRRFQFHSGALSGRDAILVDGNLARHKPSDVSPEFEHSIGPVEHSWAPAEEIAGTLTFPRPPPNALLELRFSIRGFNHLLLNYDEAGNRYGSSVSSPELQEQHTQNPMVRAGALHQELTTQLSKLSAALNQRDRAKFLEQFVGSGDADPMKRPESILASIGDVPVKSIQFNLAPGQELTPVGGGKQIRKLSAFMDYSIDGTAAEERFRSDLLCSFVREDATSPWLIDGWQFTRNPPFWLLGLTGRHSTDHFLIFYRDGPEAERILDLSCRQLENAYSQLERYPELELGERYLAFLMDQGDDFATITGMAGEHLEGAASSSYKLDGSEYAVFNRAMFINDESLRRHTWWGEARQKTITHELVHLILSGDTRPFTPTWLVEGAAVHLTNQIDTRTRWALLRSGRLDSISLSQLSRGSFPGHEKNARELGLEYHYSGEAARYLVKKFGLSKFLAYYRSFAKVSPAEVDAHWRRLSGSGKPGDATAGAVMFELTNKLTKSHFEGGIEEVDRQVKAAIKNRK